MQSSARLWLWTACEGGRLLCMCRLLPSSPHPPSFSCPPFGCVWDGRRVWLCRATVNGSPGGLYDVTAQTTLSKRITFVPSVPFDAPNNSPTKPGPGPISPTTANPPPPGLAISGSFADWAKELPCLPSPFATGQWTVDVPGLVPGHRYWFKFKRGDTGAWLLSAAYPSSPNNFGSYDNYIDV